MISKSLIERLLNHVVYIYVKGINKEFSGIIKSIEDDIVLVEDNKNNINYIPISSIEIITERR